ncbi:MAG: zinc ribbon domain-containing protein [Clostridia bacterium]|nr:zinc ribbon domain-containing protein [Clostridia bacterium]
MYCSKCGAQNADTDAFCGQCGAKLSAASPTGAPGGDGQGAIPTPPPAMDSRAEFAMLRPPEAEMRPLTKVAYDIHDSDQGPVVGSVLSVIFVGLCVGMIANLLAIFDKMSKLTQSLRTSGETYLSQNIYEQMGGSHTMGLMWLCLLFALLVLLYILVGKLKLRLKKISRKERRFKQKGIYIDI